MSGYWAGVIAILCINVLLSYSVFVTAAAGQLNLGAAGFMAIGAVGAALASSEVGLPLAASIAIGAAATALVGFLISFPVLRTRGVYMVLATFAFAEFLSGVMLAFPRFGGATGLVVAEHVGLAWLLPITIAATLAVFYLMSTRLGLAMRSIHDDELVSTVMGVNVRAVQVAAFTIGGALAGLGGALYAHHYNFIEAPYFNALLSIYVLLFVLIGGTQTAWGPLVGASFFTIVPELLRLGGSSWRYVIFGCLIVLMMIWRPEGLVTRTLIARLSLLKWLAPKRKVAADG